jgi:hypothetical protein
MLKEGAEYRLRHRLPAPAYASASDEVSVYVVRRFLCALLCAVVRIVVMLFVASVRLHLLLLTYKRHMWDCNRDICISSHGDPAPSRVIRVLTRRIVTHRDRW